MTTDSPNKSDSPDNNSVSEIMTSLQVMAYLHVSRTKLWKLVNEDGLPAFKLGDRGDYRYQKSKIDEWIQQHSVSASKPQED